MHVFTTDQVKRGERLDYWSALASDSLLPMRVNASTKAPFEGRMWTADLGAVDIVRAYSTAAVISSTREEVARSRNRRFLLSMSEAASFSFRTKGREQHLRGGDFALTDSAEPWECVHAGCAVIVVRFSEEVAKQHLPMIEDVIGTVVAGDRGAGAVASTMIRSVARGVSKGLDVSVNDHLAAALLHAVVAAYAQVCDLRGMSRKTPGVRRFEIKRFVDKHLQDANLTVQAVASAFSISGRYVRMMFEAEGESLGAYIHRRRLEESARQLRDPLWRTRTISEIALSWGFNSLGSYDRAFKAHFDITPRQYRCTE